jgi:hypothetical protein
LQIKVKDILDNCLLFSCSKLLAIRLAIYLGEGSIISLLEGRLINIIHVGSALEGFKLALFIGLNSKLYSAFL